MSRIGHGLGKTETEHGSFPILTYCRFSWANGLFGECILDLHKRKPDILKQSFQASLSLNNDDIGAPAGDFDPKPTLLVGVGGEPGLINEPVDHDEKPADHSDEQDHSHAEEEASNDESANQMSETVDDQSHDVPHGLQPGSLADMHWFWYLTSVLAIGSFLTIVLLWGVPKKSTSSM